MRTGPHGAGRRGAEAQGAWGAELLLARLYRCDYTRATKIAFFLEKNCLKSRILHRLTFGIISMGKNGRDLKGTICDVA